ncbi:hypothetical protein AUJ84_01730 [Candidatus Pacearchaeota archaeon CG1_02_32_132]|nr:MAG: hypothetical protein AUJ84_01730 [Candidatus Pacearchaeota archaeon CG1_02_32_132]
MVADLLSRIKEIRLIQGGMGAGVSNWRLARAVSSSGRGLGVVSGVALGNIVARRLEEGDTEMRDAILKFPDGRISEEIINTYFVPAGKRDPTQPYKPFPFPNPKADSNKNVTLPRRLEGLIVASTFAEVSLAKQGHDNPVGINLLYKIEWPTLPALYGAMLAGVDAVLIGAGLPRTIPEVLDGLSRNQPVFMDATVTNGENYRFHFDPKNIIDAPIELERPTFLAIVNGHLAARGVSKADGYIVEGPNAGGHNAPARSKALTESGEPDFGEKDNLNLEAFQKFLTKNQGEKRLPEQQPYWFAGGYANRLSEARQLGAQGVQVGTPFAFSYESGIPLDAKKELIGLIMKGCRVFTDPLASPSGFPFKVIPMPGSLSDVRIYEGRARRGCNIGHLAEIVEIDETLTMRCPGEPIKDYVRKGGKEEETIGRTCLCNALVSTIGLGSPGEPPIYTSGKDHEDVITLVKESLENTGELVYPASKVIDYILRNQ